MTWIGCFLLLGFSTWLIARKKTRPSVTVIDPPSPPAVSEIPEIVTYLPRYPRRP